MCDKEPVLRTKTAIFLLCQKCYDLKELRQKMSEDWRELNPWPANPKICNLKSEI